ncbi:hypothetical protein BC938DRAFT_473277 [Jimgerdemannia flammicorona]|uniref:Uncharacterized protein n=1 Tax=Jimgerdemannia flammicorona TaxID=994334 RepID=A0A433Q4J9_9FUNG|nr:hypothetical protein BC938DRAFT_473277 [Jimgerdemannia flammicorona]
MCYTSTCTNCNKTIWKGCGREIEPDMHNIPAENLCQCARHTDDQPDAQSVNGRRAVGERTTHSR